MASIGSHKCNAWSIPQDRMLSRRHCLIEYKDGAFLLSDMNSSHGTLLRIREDQEYLLQVTNTNWMHLSDADMFMLFVDW